MGRAGSGSSSSSRSSGSHSSSRSSGGHRSSGRSGGSSHSRVSSSFGGSHSYTHSPSYRHTTHTTYRSSYSNPQSYYDDYHGYGSPSGPVSSSPSYYSSPEYRQQCRREAAIRTKMTYAFVCLFILVVMIFGICANISSKPQSTRNRDKLTQVPAYNADCIIDELYWFDSQKYTGQKLESFYNETGIQPYIYLRDYDASLKTDKEKEEYAVELFDELGLTENTFLYVYFAEEDVENDVGFMCYVNGKMVDSIMDSEAIGIFWGYIDSLWYTDYSTDTVFTETFKKTAKTIMHRSTTTKDIIFVAIVGCAIAIIPVSVIIVMNKKRKHEAERAKETERIFKASMEDLSKSSESDPLIDKYK